MTTSGPDFISLQSLDVARSAEFYEKHLGFTRQAGPPHAVVFDSKPVPVAIREPLPGVNLSTGAQLGLGIGVWMYVPNAQETHDGMVAAGVTITSAPIDGPFGRTFTFADPDGYQITLHDKA